MGKRKFPEAFPHFHNKDREASGGFCVLAFWNRKGWAEE